MRQTALIILCIIARLGVKSIIGGTLAAFVTVCIAGMLL